jgi:hypothetical protein
LNVLSAQLFFTSIDAESNVPGDVAVCGKKSSLRHTTVSPAWTVSSAGSNAIALIVTT